MKKLLYLTTEDYSDKLYSGVFKKINYQIKAFKDSGYEVDLTYISSDSCAVHLIKQTKDTVIGKYKSPRGISTKKILYRYLLNDFDVNQYECVYIRFLGGRTDPWHLQILKYLHSKNVAIVLEIPTYPYDLEKARKEIFVDKLFRNNMKKYVDRVVTHAKETNIFGIPTIKTTNGIDVDSIVPISGRVNNGDEIHLIAVASFEIAHGYERIIESLSTYANMLNRPVHIHMVGDGVDRPMYERLVKEYSLEEYVHFYGRKFNDDLLEIYEKADIALGCLGIYKKGLETVSSLKSVEYVAKGLPVINGFHEELFDDANEFVCEFPNNDTHIDMQLIIDWYDELIKKYHNKLELRDSIRSFAMNTVDISAVMRPIVEFFDGKDR